MRVVDTFTDVLLFVRKFCRGEIETMPAEQLRAEFQDLFDKSKRLAEDNGILENYYQAAKFPVVALVDEMLQTSSWSDKSNWSKNSLQRIYFGTTNAGSEFYERLNVLSKFGPDRDVREVYSLCLGLGFRGRYFRGEDRKRYEDTKAFNLSLLLPDEAQRNIDSATLFPFAYKASDARNDNPFKSRFSIYPIIFGVPVAVLVLMIGIYHLKISWVLDQIQSMVNY
jgi:type VI secretion system protein ImpK